MPSLKLLHTGNYTSFGSKAADLKPVNVSKIGSHGKTNLKIQVIVLSSVQHTEAVKPIVM